MEVQDESRRWKYKMNVEDKVEDESRNCKQKMKVEERRVHIRGFMRPEKNSPH